MISDMIPRVIRDRKFLSELIQKYSVSVTRMFRDPLLYRTIRQEVVPWLKTYPSVKIWHAGCSTGEEVYSMAILLHEEGLYDHATIYATDFNDRSLRKAKEGIYAVDNIQEATKDYRNAGGKRSFSDYYHSRYDAVAMSRRLKRRITFANHNLVTDEVFSEVHLIFCRNVMIYFNRDLQDRVLRLFAESLVRRGFLCLGARESLHHTAVVDDFEVFDRKAKVYKRIK